MYLPFVLFSLPSRFLQRVAFWLGPLFLLEEGVETLYVPVPGRGVFMSGVALGHRPLMMTMMMMTSPRQRQRQRPGHMRRLETTQTQAQMTMLMTMPLDLRPGRG